MNDSSTIADVFKLGSILAFSLFMLLYFNRIMNADSASEATEIFAQTFYALTFTIVPTSPAVLVLDFIGGIIGAAITTNMLPRGEEGLKIVLGIAAFGFGWTAINITINWFTAPV